MTHVMKILAALLVFAALTAPGLQAGCGNWPGVDSYHYSSGHPRLNSERPPAYLVTTLYNPGPTTGGGYVYTAKSSLGESQVPLCLIGFTGTLNTDCTSSGLLAAGESATFVFPFTADRVNSIEVQWAHPDHGLVVRTHELVPNLAKQSLTGNCDNEPDYIRANVLLLEREGCL